MSETPTPGQIGYEAYMGTLALGGVRHGPPTWQHLTALHHEAWEAAAQAVLDHATVRAVAEAAVHAALAQCTPQEEMPCP